ncbi:D-alanine aminotransferase [Alteromonas aestuariivivens]|uniref:Aminodeoxychorismate lyase n=1 Tax=Alteromonas aestuariivivens TaxID=1938339 RepID=A0A3D8MBC5_9ALTE|nr:aminotransferase class IV [Alteromonas aestuariivivens]RDV27395.1 D-alanine aminotransferase [Alteromonas aestuariivivens]
MTIAFLNGQYLPLDEARISPMDRGFLFGDGIYEVIPSYGGKAVGLAAHLERMNNGLAELEIKNPYRDQEYQQIISTLILRNKSKLASDNIGVYLHVSRGTDTKRFHAYPKHITATIFAFAFEISPPPPADRKLVKGLKVSLCEDLRWHRCHIKSTALLGNVMHFEHGQRQGNQETILYNRERQVTEASSSNVFVVDNGVIRTPPLDNQLLPGITRKLALESFKREGLVFSESVVTVRELLNAQEVWLTSSSKEISPVIEVDGHKVGSGRPGPVWERAIQAYNKYKFSC